MRESLANKLVWIKQPMSLATNHTLLMYVRLCRLFHDSLSTICQQTVKVIGILCAFDLRFVSCKFWARVSWLSEVEKTWEMFLKSSGSFNFRCDAYVLLNINTNLYKGQYLVWYNIQMHWLFIEQLDDWMLCALCRPTVTSSIMADCRYYFVLHAMQVFLH